MGAVVSAIDSIFDDEIGRSIQIAKEDSIQANVRRLSIQGQSHQTDISYCLKEIAELKSKNAALEHLISLNQKLMTPQVDDYRLPVSRTQIVSYVPPSPGSHNYSNTWGGTWAGATPVVPPISVNRAGPSTYAPLPSPDEWEWKNSQKKREAEIVGAGVVDESVSRERYADISVEDLEGQSVGASSSVLVRRESPAMGTRSIEAGTSGGVCP